MGMLYILTGPSGVGKSPLDKALQTFHADLRDRMAPVVLYNSRSPRPGEVEGKSYYFRSRSEIEALQEDSRFVVMEVRGDLQAFDREEYAGRLKETDVFYEGNPFMAQALLEEIPIPESRKLSVFVSPLNEWEISRYRTRMSRGALERYLIDIMRRKLQRRTLRQKNLLSLQDLENIETRAGSALEEIRLAPTFNWILPNHDGEDSENWDMYYFPIGDAGRATEELALLFESGEGSGWAEKWDKGIVS